MDYASLVDNFYNQVLVPKLDLPVDNISLTMLLLYLNKSQYTFKHENIDASIPILTKMELRKHVPLANALTSSTSGSTGIPVVVTKTLQSKLWYEATNIRELLWRKWDLTKLTVAILARFTKDQLVNSVYQKSLDCIKNLQLFLEEVQPYYLYTYPSIIKLLDLSKLTNLRDVKSTGEIGATSYSSEETGTIAIQCPDYPTFYHIMENIIVETHDAHGILVTDLTNPLITRYALGDVVELGQQCPCNRSLKTISKIYGRIRNMLVLPNNNKIWPTFGEPKFRTITNKIIRHQIVQKDLINITVFLQVTEPLTIMEQTNLLTLMQTTIKYNHFIYNIQYVDTFPLGKFEPFKTELL